MNINAVFYWRSAPVDETLPHSIELTTKKMGEVCGENRNCQRASSCWLTKLYIEYYDGVHSGPNTQLFLFAELVAELHRQFK